MHLFFSGIGGAGIAPLALIAKRAGFDVSGSDKQNTKYIDYLKSHGVDSIEIGQTREQIEQVNAKGTIDWFIYSSAVTIEQPDSAEIGFCKEHGIKTSKRDEFINYFLTEKHLKMLAVAGTSGKTTTLALLAWLFKKSGVPVSYTMPAKIPFGDLAEFNPESQWFLYEADEFDYNFLSFEPEMSLITAVSWDHHEIFKTREDYQQAFIDFCTQSKEVLIWQDDWDYLNPPEELNASVLDPNNPRVEQIKLPGKYNRLDAYLTIEAVHKITAQPIDKLIELASDFPGLERRMEEIVPNLYTDYAHNPEKIRGAMSVALEMAADEGCELVVIYEPLTDRRQHYIIDDYKDCFDGASVVYWLPSYLAREDPNQRVIPPEELISHLTDPGIAKPMKRDHELITKINEHLENGDMVVGMNGGGGDSLDEWLRANFKDQVG